MKNQVFAAVLAFSLSLPLAALAQIEAPQMLLPESDTAPVLQIGAAKLSTPSQIAMVYYKLANQEPPYVRWAENSEAFKTASEFDRSHILESQVSQLKDVYNLSLVRETFVVEMPVKLSAYSFKNKGFLVESFSPETLFPYAYGGDNFAVVIASLMDFQWLPVPEETAMRLDMVQAKSGGALKLLIHADPASADKGGPVLIGDKHYYLVSARMAYMQILDPATNDVLWEQDFRDVVGEQEAPDPKLLNLYKTNN